MMPCPVGGVNPPFIPENDRAVLAAREPDFSAALRHRGLPVPDNPGLMDIVGAVSEAIDSRLPNNNGRTDLGEMAQAAACEGIVEAVTKRTGGRLLDGATVQLVNTDPPYNVGVASRSNNAIAASGDRPIGQQGMDMAIRGETHATTEKLRPKDRPLVNDFISDEEFARLLRLWFGNIQLALEPGRAFYIWGGYSNIWNYPNALRESQLYFSQMIIWVKEHPVLTRKDGSATQVERVPFAWRRGAVLAGG